MNDKFLRVYKCPNCGYMFSEEEYQQARFDYECPNRDCWKHLLDFYPIRMSLKELQDE